MTLYNLMLQSRTSLETKGTTEQLQHHHHHEIMHEIIDGIEACAQAELSGLLHEGAPLVKTESIHIGAAPMMLLPKSTWHCTISCIWCTA